MDRAKDEKPHAEFLETSVNLQETHEKALEYEASKDPDKINMMYDWLAEKYKQHDLFSNDCHSFAATILNLEFGIPAVFPPNVLKPNRADYEWETEWQLKLSSAIYEARQTPQYQQYLTAMKNYQDGLYEHSTHYLLPRYSVVDKEDVARGVKYGEGLGQEILDTFQRNSLSRILLISERRDSGIMDVHTVVVLGPTEDNTDLWVLEKSEVGAPVSIDRLSEVLSRYCFYIFNHGAYEVSVCDISATKLYPATSGNVY